MNCSRNKLDFKRVPTLGTLFFVMILTISCTKETPPPKAPGEKPTEAEMPKTGQRIYSTQCVSCHGPDPKKDGALGPAIFGSSLELIKTRIEGTEYPAGYTPKRTTKVMQPMPHLKGEIENIHKFLNTNQ